MDLTVKDIEKLYMVFEKIEKGTATTYDKPACLEALTSVLEPKCAVCRKEIKEFMVVVNDRKMHEKCRSKYKG